MEAKAISKLLILSLLGLFLFQFSCSSGGSSSGGGSSNGVPQVGVSLENTTIRRGDTVYGTLSWSDSDGDIVTVYAEDWYGPARWDSSAPASQFGINGSNGTSRIYFTTKSTASLGIHTTKFYVRDAKGQQSNIVEINIRVNAKENAMDTDIKSPVLDTGGVR